MKEFRGESTGQASLAGALTQFFAIWRFPLGKATKKSEGLARIFYRRIRLLFFNLRIVAVTNSFIMD